VSLEASKSSTTCLLVDWIHRMDRTRGSLHPKPRIHGKPGCSPLTSVLQAVFCFSWIHHQQQSLQSFSSSLPSKTSRIQRQWCHSLREKQYRVERSHIHCIQSFLTSHYIGNTFGPKSDQRLVIKLKMK